MAQSSRLKILKIVPGDPNRQNLLREFATKGGDIVALSGPALKAHVEGLDESHLGNPMLFGVWVRKCAVAVGATPLRLVTDNLLEEAIGAALDEEPEDSPFALAKRFPGTRKALSRTLSELQEAGVNGERLDELVPACGEILQPKAKAIARIALRVESICRELGFGTLLDNVEVCLPLKTSVAAPLERTLLIVTDDWHEVAERFCRWFCERGGRLTLLVEGHADNLDDGFLASRQVLEALPEICPEVPASPTSTFLQNLFGSSFRVPEDQHLHVRVVSCPDPFSECEEAVRGLRSALDAGVPPGRLALFARDMEAYGVPLEAASKRQGVPLSLPRRAPLRSNGWIRFLLATLEALAGSDVRDLLRPVSSSYLGLLKPEREAVVEKIREAYRNREKAWQDLGEGENPETLTKLLLWRREATADRFSLGEWLGLLNQLRTELRPDRDPASPTVERDTRAHFVLARALNARVSVQNVAGASKFGLKAFAKICRETADLLDVSLPAGPGVPVQTDPEGLAGYDRVWALGLLEGQFPRRRREDPILHDLDREDLARLGIRLQTSVEKANAERDGFYRVAASARTMLTLSYPETDEDRDNIPAFYLEEALRAGGHLSEKVRYERSRLAPPLSECNNDADRNLRNAMDAQPKEGPLPVEFHTDRPMTALGRSPSWEPSVKDLRDVMRCPFQYLGRRLLGLRSTQMARRWAGLRNIPVRGKLASQTEPVAARQAMLLELEEEITRIMPDATEWEVSGFRVGGLRLIDEWIEREFEARKLWREGPVRHEVALQEIDPDSGFRKWAVGGMAPAVTEGPKYRVLHLYEGSQPEIGEDGFKDQADLLYYGVHLLASFRTEPNRTMAIEIETQRDGRKMLFMPRMGNLTARPTQRLNLKDLSVSDHANESIKLFSKEVRAVLDDAKNRLRTLSVTPTPGDHCAWCDLGELCRRSAKFSEESDPFDARELHEED